MYLVRTRIFLDYALLQTTTDFTSFLKAFPSSKNILRSYVFSVIFVVSYSFSLILGNSDFFFIF